MVTWWSISHLTFVCATICSAHCLGSSWDLQLPKSMLTKPSLCPDDESCTSNVFLAGSTSSTGKMKESTTLTRTTEESSFRPSKLRINDISQPKSAEPEWVYFRSDSSISSWIIELNSDAACWKVKEITLWRKTIAVPEKAVPTPESHFRTTSVNLWAQHRV